MAKNNLFLGKARGKVGDVVLSILDGKQVSRARNRSPKNPKTNKQMYQRAIMASVMQMYAAGKMIFDHSFEGKNVKFGAMRRFMSVNARKLRADVMADLQNNTSNARVVHQGAVTPTPYTFRVSEGLYGAGHLLLHPQVDNIPKFGFDGWEDAGDFYADEQFIQNDIFTVLILYVDGEMGGATSLVSPATSFGFVRMTVKNEVPHEQCDRVNYSQVFDVETNNLKPVGTLFDTTMDQIIDAATLVPAGSTPVAIALIRSAKDSGLRSTADFVCLPDMPWGVKAQNILDVWNPEVQPLGNSELILEGGDINGSNSPTGGGGGGGGSVTISGRTTGNASLASGYSGTIQNNPAARAEMSDGTTRVVINNTTDKYLVHYNNGNYVTLSALGSGDPAPVFEVTLEMSTWASQQFVTVQQMRDAGY